MFKNKKGFTLIELLVVIAVLGVLATVVIAAINPFQQLMKGRDSARLNITASMGQAMLAYATANNGGFIAQSATWITGLVTAGEVNNVPGSIAYASGGAPCASANVQSGLCYTGPTAAAPTNPFIIFAKMEATLNISKCGGTMTTAWAVFSSAAGRGGVVCTTGGDPVSSDAYGNCAASPCTAADQFTQ